MTHQIVVADRLFCAIRPVHRAWSSVTLCVPTLETVTGRWCMSRKTREDRQMGGQIDGQSAIEMVTNSQWTLSKTREDTETDREAARGRNDDRQLAEKQERVGRWTDRQMGSRRIDWQRAIETMRDSRRIDGQSAVEMVIDSWWKNKRG